ncbi:VOC family protein [Aspergillus brunneoviolaceus CBS 621.78]|uniref:DUF1338-domain-containing protein n=1 Tax=Aspergillus brunneoviolaceus CBS 621.78 TaxID=1450534 RepID=A0ACD1G0X0_9EURO|nr:DUF1338-domain-containing protein [Aspergillus brunneoviolaceus CBS 621.78]RAH42912.1 DUF1338-domain-containing protein [Aspergillus brunneoviolaceus CBS 621.78]
MSTSVTVRHIASPHHAAASQYTGEDYVHRDDLRSTFAANMSAMYRAEVPLYGDLVRIVSEVNRAYPIAANEAHRLGLERHGAIRLGTPQELQTIRRVFALLGMAPVGYYDLAVAGLPMHATCFRPTEASALQKNPFRVFTTLLRPELITTDSSKQIALDLLSRRQIFTDDLLLLLDQAEAQGGQLTGQQAESFITNALESFRWQGMAAATVSQYQEMRKAHPILADIASFTSAHINHLTPRALDIEESHRQMARAGMAVKDRIEGPPRRACPILLRQTSFLALEESIGFREDGPSHASSARVVQGSHKARFGEIEQRGAAPTTKGRQLYDALLDEALQRADAEHADASRTDEIMAEVFAQYPDDWTELRRQGLVYFEYSCRQTSFDPSRVDAASDAADLLDQLIQQSVIVATPITYEDFLPFSAAGIFQSNLTSKSAFAHRESTADEAGFNRSLGATVLDMDGLYASHQRQSVERCFKILGLELRA